MYDLSKEFNEFYSKCVILPNDKQSNLRQKKNLNIKRLIEGLQDYNEEHSTDYKISETRVQGSMAMHTVTQNDSNEYDIDVAIIFEKNNLGENTTAVAARQIVTDALKKKCANFNVEPERKINCVRVTYAEGYHIDFAVYRRFKEGGTNEYSYEHAGASWSSRSPAAINNWFADAIDFKGDCLRKVIRLSKMFCKSRDGWANMPGGLLQTVVCDEKLENSYDRIDEIFYYTMKQVKERLDASIDVYNPTDISLPLITTGEHETKMQNWCNRLENKLEKLDILFDDECTESQAKNAWYEFFNHDYWNEIEVKKSVCECFASLNQSYENTEQFIEDMMNINEEYYARIKCTVSSNGFRRYPVFEFLSKFNIRYLPHGLSIDFDLIDTNVPQPYEVWWKVRNVGEEAQRRNAIRGQIEKRCGSHKHETSNFYGPHYVECYIIKNGQCVAVDHVEVPIDK